MNTRIRTLTLATVSASAVLLAACSDSADDKTVGQQIDQTVSQTQQEAAEMKADAKDMAEHAGDKVDQAANTTEQTLSETASEAKADAKELWKNTKEAAGNAGEAISETVSDAGTAVADTAITTQVKAKLIDAERLDGMDISVDTESGVVTLTGMVPTDEARTLAGELASTVDGVISVTNELVVAS